MTEHRRVDLREPILRYIRDHGLTLSSLATSSTSISHATVYQILSPNSPRKGGTASSLAALYDTCGIRLYWQDSPREVLPGVPLSADYFRAAIGAGLIRERMALNALSDSPSITSVGSAQVRRYLPSMRDVAPRTHTVGRRTIQRILESIGGSDKRLCEPTIAALEDCYTVLGIEARNVAESGSDDDKSQTQS